MRLTDYHFLQEIAALDVVDAIYLFGSRARGDNRERSDIDIAVLCCIFRDDLASDFGMSRPPISVSSGH
jgi:predicted nucleotidyltransferase